MPTAETRATRLAAVSIIFYKTSLLLSTKCPFFTAESTCEADEFRCAANGRCIPAGHQCDGRSDCPDSEDELNCAQTCDEDTEFFCPEGRCVASSLRCDGTADCSGGEDEANCECSADQFKCQLGGGCILNNQRCDGYYDCADNSDEWNCIQLTEDSKLQVK